MRKPYFLIWVMVLALTATGCIKETGGANPPIHPREKAKMTNRDGTVVAKRRVFVPSPYANRVEIYRIRYLSNGLEVVGYLSKPKGEGRNKYPVIFFNRGGGLERSKINRNILQYFSYLTSKGYIVLGSQYRGNDGGQGQEEYGGDDIRDVLSLVRLADRIPYADKENKVMLGYSRGGMMTYLAMKAGVNLRAAAVVGGITDLPSFYRGRKDEPDVIQAMNRLVGDPREDREEYRKRSVIDWPEQINAPLLILHGTADSKVHPGQALKLDRELVRLNQEHRTVLFPRGNHHLDSHRRARDREILNWFNRYLN